MSRIVTLIALAAGSSLMFSSGVPAQSSLPPYFSSWRRSGRVDAMHVFLLPLLVFVLIAGFGLVRFVVFARKFRLTVQPGTEGPALHIETSAGNLDLEPLQQLNPRLKSFVLYPGAQPRIPGSPEYLASGGPPGHEMRAMAATYWTPDASGKVLDFYRSQLPQWTAKLEAWGDVDGSGHAWNFTNPAEPACSIRVRSQYGGTTIENTIELEHK